MLCVCGIQVVRVMVLNSSCQARSCSNKEVGLPIFKVLEICLVEAGIKVAAVVSMLKAVFKKKKIPQDNLPVAPLVKHVTKLKEKGF